MPRQDRIEGDYCILSAERAGASEAQNVSNARALEGDTLSMGFPVQVLQGVWEGRREFSLRVFGPGSFAWCAEQARLYKQDAFLCVGGGFADLYTWNGSDWVVSKRFTREIEVPEGEDQDNYSETLRGYRFRFEP